MEILRQISRELGIELSAGQLASFELYRSELTGWNSRFNLTAIESPEDIEVKHFADSLTLLQALDRAVLENAASVIDIGSGAGFPGLPLKIALPGIRLTLLESTAKKSAFLQYIVSRLELENVSVECARAETAAASAVYRQNFDVVVSRAVARLDTLAELCLPFCRVGGLFIAHKKGAIAAEIALSAGAVQALGGGPARVSAVSFPGLDDGRCLVVIPKIAPTPAKYPRRPGTPRKNPLK